MLMLSNANIKQKVVPRAAAAYGQQLKNWLMKEYIGMALYTNNHMTHCHDLSFLEICVAFFHFAKQER